MGSITKSIRSRKSAWNSPNTCEDYISNAQGASKGLLSKMASTCHKVGGCSTRVAEEMKGSTVLHLIGTYMLGCPAAVLVRCYQCINGGHRLGEYLGSIRLN